MESITSQLREEENRNCSQSETSVPLWQNRQFVIICPLSIYPVGGFTPL